MPARFITNDEALEMLNVWLETEFEGGRNQRRLDTMPLQK
jgi:ribose 5-phosphate isomerase B